MADASRRFSFAFTSARVDYDANGRSYITGPDGVRQDVSGVATLVFTDGAIQEQDGSPLVDDLYYYAKNPDIWAAHVAYGLDADQHYADFGWREGRDPDEFFSTSGYLAAHPDVKALGTNPLAYYDSQGWRIGQDPGPNFSTNGYLAANPDVRAAGVDPLAHFLGIGVAEGRPVQPAPPPTSVTHIAVDGLDYNYYLATYSDVRAARADADVHYQTFGWHEGRNPNAFFDTSGYLATYGDVAQAGVDPLLHYHNFGWREGRNPGPAFDSAAYLAANPDVAAAGVDPLKHYLEFGKAEGRTAFAEPLFDTDTAADGVSEGAAAGSGVGVTFSWGGWISPNLSYAITSDSSGGGFQIDSHTGRISVADGSKLDYEHSGAAHGYTVTVEARDGGFSIAKTVSIAVADVNDNAPVFTSGNAGSEPEHTPASNVVYTAHATDADGTSPNNAVTYALSGTDAAQFNIDPSTGAITFKASPSYAAPTDANHDNVYDVMVTATDGGQPALAASVAVTISVTNATPSTPVDADMTAPNGVVEGAANGTYTGLTASSTDPNGHAVTYSLTADSSGGGFTVNAATGVVSVADSSKLNYETAPGHAYSVMVQASDGTLASSQSFTIAVSDVAPSTPVDANAAANVVTEGAAAGTTVGITASSSDVNGPAVTYSLTADSSGGGFTVNAATGVVSVADPSKLDYETAPGRAYSVTVAASDGTLTSSQSFAIGVTNVAPSTPVDGDAATANAVVEGAVAGSYTGLTVSSTDPNGPAVSYSLTDDAGGRFAIDASGKVTVTAFGATHIDYESTPGHAYGVTVAASDGTATRTQSFTIGVNNAAPSTPVDANAAANVVTEGAAAGTTVGVTASSSDVNGPAVTYSLTADSSGGGFTVNAATGVVTVADPSKLDYETAPGHAYSVTVAASDGTLASSQSFTIAVNDVAPSTPVDTNAAANVVIEGAAAGTTVGITTSSNDVNGPAVTYSLTADSSGGGFTVNAATGVVTVADPSKLDYETAPGHAYNVTVQASDGTLTSSQSFAIAVTNVAPSTPVDANAAANVVAEGAAAGTTVGVTASSSDPNGPAVTYSLTADSSGGGFTVNAATGVVTVADPSKLDYETAPGHAYNVTVQASDGTLASSQSFAIAVNDVAPSTPVDANAAANVVTEGAAAGTTVGVTASSSDVNGPAVTYSLTADSSGGGFTVNAATGVVSVADSSKLNYETAPGHAYSVMVQASDGTLASSQSFTIAVSDVAPSTPVDANAAANVVTEGAAAGTTVGITASSSDVNGPAVTYSLTADSSGGGFTVNAATGVVSVADPSKLDYETAPGHAYSVTVAASDGTLTSSQSFAIGVTNVAPSTPVDGDAATANAVVEGAVAGSYTGLTVSSTDPNGPAVSYSLTDDAGGRFAIDASGKVTVTAFGATHIDYESTPGHAYGVTVAASDGTLTSSQSFTIGVTDAAPSTPVDGDNTINQVSTGAPQGTSTGLTAASSDVNGGTVTYSLVNDDGGHFQIDATTGVVTVGATAPVYDPVDMANNTRTVTVQAADASGLGSTQSFTIAISPNTPPVAHDDATSATESGGVDNNVAGSNPTGNVVLGTGGHGEAQDTDQEDASSALTVVAVRTGSEGSSGQVAGAVGSALAGQYGSLTLNADGSYTYVVDNTNATVEALNPAQTLTDTFNYTVRDTGGLQDTATITVTIHGANDAPTAHADAVSATEAGGVGNGTPGVNPAFNVITGTGETGASGADTDPDSGDVLTVVGVVAGMSGATLSTGAGSDVAGSYGTIHIDADGSATYQVNQAAANSLAAGQTATDTFSYTVQDIGGLHSTTQVAVTVHGANDAPTAVADSSASPGAIAATEAGGVANGTPGSNGSGNVLANDTDPDQGDTLTVQGVEAGNNTAHVVSTGAGTAVAGNFGSITIQANGSYTYVVDQAAADSLRAGSSATDFFTYTARDAAGLTSTSIVAVTINGANDAPVAVADGSSASPIDVTSGNQATTNLLANDTDADVPHTLTAIKDSNGAHGTVVVNANGTFTYTANAGFYGTDSFTYHANDGASNSNTATVTVRVAPNVAYINSASASGTEDGSVANPYKSIASFNAANDASHNYNIIYVQKGATGTYSSATGITLRAGQILEGQGVDPSYVDAGTGQTVVMQDFDNTAGSLPTITITGGTNAVTLSTNNTIAGLKIAATGAVNGIADNGGSVGTFGLQGVGISTVNGNGLSLTHGGTFTAGSTATTSTDSTIENATISTSGTGTALNVVNTTIGSGHATFQSISATGSSGNAGIILDNTGSSGGLHVTGVGANIGASGGGVIATKTGGDINTQNADGSANITGTGGTGIFLRNTTDVQLNGLQLNDFSNYAILGDTVTGLAINHTTINGVNGNNDAVNEGSIWLQQLLGSASIVNSTISGGWEDNLHVQNASGSLNRLTIDNVGFGANGASAGNEQVNVVANNSATVNLTVQNSSFSGSRSTNIQYTQGATTAGQTPHGDVLIANNTFTGAASQVSGAAGILLTSGGSTNPTLTYSVHDNTINGMVGNGITIGKGSGTGSWSGTIDHNTVTGNAANGGADGISIIHAGGGTNTVAITNNTITKQSGDGISLQVGDNTSGGDGVVFATVTGNSVKNAFGSFPNAAFELNNGTTSSGEAGGDHSIVHLTLGGAGALANDFATGGGQAAGTYAEEVRLRERFSATTYLSGYNGGATDDAAVASYVAGRNILTSPGASQVVVSHGSGSATWQHDPMLAALGGIDSDTPNAGETSLTLSELGSVVSAAIAQWAAAGATASQLALLKATTFSVADLTGSTIGTEGSGHITIDVDAAGHGWFIDPTPNDNFEFGHSANASGTDLFTDPSSAAAGHMDLLTVITHELGHVIGLPDTTLPGDGHDLMYASLVAGERRLPVAANVAQANAAQADAASAQSTDAAAGQHLVATAAPGSVSAGAYAPASGHGGGHSDAFQFGHLPSAMGGSAPWAAGLASAPDSGLYGLFDDRPMDVADPEMALVASGAPLGTIAPPLMGPLDLHQFHHAHHAIVV